MRLVIGGNKKVAKDEKEFNLGKEKSLKDALAIESIQIRNITKKNIHFQMDASYEISNKIIPATFDISLGAKELVHIRGEFYRKESFVFRNLKKGSIILWTVFKEDLKKKKRSKK